MRFCFSKAVAAVLITSQLAACSVRWEPDMRRIVPGVDEQRFSKIIPPPPRAGLLEDLYEDSEGLSACNWVESLGHPREAHNRFRLIGDIDVSELNSGPALFDVKANVDVGGSPLYSYALLSQQIPGKAEFLALVDQEIAKSTITLPLLMIARWLMSIGIINPFKQRNSAIQDRINEALPGIFSGDRELFAVRDSIPWMILKNGNPDLEGNRFTVGDSDSRGARREKKNELGRVLGIYASPVPLFYEESWRSVEDDFRTGLSVSIRGLMSKEPTEKACSTVILHRALAQMLTITGFDRLPSRERADRKTSHLPELKELLDHEEGNQFRVCPMAGVFALNGRTKIMGRDALAGYDSRTMVYDLAATPAAFPDCEPSRAVSTGSDAYARYDGEELGATATGTSWLSFMGSITHFLVAFNPGAVWWKSPDNTIGFPMSPFESLDRIKSSGAILPADVHALALGLLNVSMGTLRAKHLVFLNDRMREVTDLSQTSKIRFSEAPRKNGDLGPIVTTVHAATLLAEIAFKLSDSLAHEADWKRDAENAVKEELARETDRHKRQALLKDYRNFIETMFGSEEILNALVSEEPDSVRSILKDLKLASALLAASYARKESDGRFSCYDSLVLDPSTGVEEKRGSCSGEDRKLWKYMMRLIARDYRSPIYAEFAN